MIAAESTSHWLWPDASVIFRQGTLVAPLPCCSSARWMALCWASRCSMGSERRRISCRTLMQNGQVLNWYSARFWHCRFTVVWAAGSRTTPFGWVRRSFSSMNGPSTARTVLKKARTMVFMG
ncbi:hypothetical protein Y695_04568 [Hydrogenophaga sp. T4]|nr:hypothetical protein Y695_04568 [Hydrogenophaga sp. T4]